MKFLNKRICLVVLILGITVSTSVNLNKSKAITNSKTQTKGPTASEYLPNKCRGGAAKVLEDLKHGLSNLSPSNWETAPNRKKSYAEKCGCPGITAYSDNSKLPFNYMQCCLRNEQNCTVAQHPAIFTVINLASSELASNTCRGTVNWNKRKTLTQENFVYRGQSEFFAENERLSEAQIKELIKKDTIWRYKAFTSFSHDLKRAAGYSNEKGTKSNTFILRVTGNAKLRGLFIENCSLYPQEKEFLVDKNSCFRVSREETRSKTVWKSDGIPEGTAEFRFIDLEPINCSEAGKNTIREL